MIGMVQKTVQASDSRAWMLDTGSTTHVCIDRSRFVSEKKSRASFKVWTGDVTRGVMSGIMSGTALLKTVDDDVPTEEMAMLTVNADASPLMRWHERLGHLNVGTIKHMMDNGTVTGMGIPKELFKKKFVPQLHVHQAEDKVLQEKRSRKAVEGEL
ncbi:hypothetical protein PR001_g5444 [Phytophthora rubi]|uniref:GAG-pre-integrase domain-containing protein n=1 Tax=Phytophthora rubi TaxID=129364 RepID=A0A6A3NSR2_9STRA|nr:hypothetical protein PR001_g5444 [Phytophthora rubi]